MHTINNRVSDVSQKIEGLDALVNLEELWLGKNKISKLEVSRSIVAPNLSIHTEFTVLSRVSQT